MEEQRSACVMERGETRDYSSDRCERRLHVTTRSHADVCGLCCHL